MFVAVQPSPGFMKALEELQERLRVSGADGRYRDPSGLHLTLAFIGEWPENIAGLLPAVRKPFPITLSHTGIFPKANVLWAGIRPSEELELLAGRVRQRLEENGIPFDRKDFCPHITLARKPVLPEQALLRKITVPPVSMTVEEICLYRSDRGEKGMEYTVIGRSRGGWFHDA